MPLMKKFSKIICGTVLAAGGIYIFNHFYDLYAARKHLLRASHDQYYDWRGIKVYFRKSGSGTPLILLHSIHPCFSSAEWEKAEKELSKNHTVYALDFPGCGRSDKPGITFTSFLYASMLANFIQDMSIVGADIAASDLSCVTAILSEAYEPGLLGKFIFINPPAPSGLSETPDLRSKTLRTLFQLPLVGSFIYNILFSRQKIDRSFSEQYLYNPFHDHEKVIDICFESAHLGHGNGAFLAGSLSGKYLNFNIDYAAKRLKNPVRIIEGEKLKNSDQITKEWKMLMPDAEVVFISHARQFPHMEEPVVTVEKMRDFL